MNNKQFTKEYGKIEMRELLTTIFIRLSILKNENKIGNFKINNRKRLVHLFNRGVCKTFEVAFIYSLSDNELFSLYDNIK